MAMLLCGIRFLVAAAAGRSSSRTIAAPSTSGAGGHVAAPTADPAEGAASATSTDRHPPALAADAARPSRRERPTTRWTPCTRPRTLPTDYRASSRPYQSCVGSVLKFRKESFLRRFRTGTVSPGIRARPGFPTGRPQPVARLLPTPRRPGEFEMLRKSAIRHPQVRCNAG
jgi:hypothetical protein